MTPLQALLDFAFAGRAAGLAQVRELMLQKARAARIPDPEDAAQSLMLKLCFSPGRARAMLDRFGARNAALGAAFESTPPGGVPSLTPEVRAHAEGQVVAYIGSAMRNRAKDLRRQPPAEELPESDRLHAAPVHEESSELLVLRGRVLAAIESETSRPAWLDETITAIEALATGEKTMDELTAQCVAADPSLLALPPATARTRARNRLQQQHQRARVYLFDTIARMVTARLLLPDEGSTAGRWVELLMRRQKRAPGASRRSKP